MSELIAIKNADGAKIEALRKKFEAEKPAGSEVPFTDLDPDDQRYVKERRVSHTANSGQYETQKADESYAKFAEQIFSKAIRSGQIFDETSKTIVMGADSEYDDYSHATDISLFIIDKSKEHSDNPADFASSTFLTIDVTSTSASDYGNARKAVDDKLAHDPTTGKDPISGDIYESRRGFAPIKYKSAFNPRSIGDKYIPVSNQTEPAPHFVVGFSKDTLDIIRQRIENGAKSPLDQRHEYMLLRQLSEQSRVYKLESDLRLKEDPTNAEEQKINQQYTTINDFFQESLYSFMLAKIVNASRDTREPDSSYKTAVENIYKETEKMYNNKTLDPFYAYYDREPGAQKPKIPRKFYTYFDELALSKKESEKFTEVEKAHQAIMDSTADYKIDIDCKTTFIRKKSIGSATLKATP